ncbi:MAG: YraN family protein [Bacteroidetes bacterium]|nr:YraN family protein [Bacteroidota bacterium]
MAAHNELGKKGELLALNWLMQHGYETIYKNWRFAHVEVDIIASKEMILHFIEVKSRSNRLFGFPEESITKKKLENLMLAAEEFLFQFPSWKRIQYDVLSISINKKGEADYFFIEDVYMW